MSISVAPATARLRSAVPRTFPIRRSEQPRSWRRCDWARENTDADDVSLFGICSGAFHAFHAALLQASVDHLILVNPAIFYLAPDDTIRNSTGKAVTAAHNLHRLKFVRSQLPAALRSPRDMFGFLRRAGRGFIYLWAARIRRILGRIGISLREPEDLARDLNALAGQDITTLRRVRRGRARRQIPAGLRRIDPHPTRRPRRGHGDRHRWWRPRVLAARRPTNHG